MHHLLDSLLVYLLLICYIITPTYGQRLDVTEISSCDEFSYSLFEISPDGTWYVLLENGELLTSEDEGDSWSAFDYP